MLTGIKNLIEIASQVEFNLSGDIFIRKASQNLWKQTNIRDVEEFEPNGSRDIEVQLYLEKFKVKSYERRSPFQLI